MFVECDQFKYHISSNYTQIAMEFAQKIKIIKLVHNVFG